MSVSIIGGADGPTSVFLAGRAGPGWISVFGLILIVLLLIPNLVYWVLYRGQKKSCSNRMMAGLEQIGRYASMLLMIFPLGTDGFGFRSVGAFLAYGAGNAVLMTAYWILWMLYLYRQDFWKRMALAVIPTGIFLLSGVTLLKIPLIASAVIFGIAHIYVTCHEKQQ